MADINTGVVAAQIYNLKDEWAALHGGCRLDRRTKRYKAESARISGAIDTQTHRYSDATGMNHTAVLRHFDLI
jgi:hypothetical protein